MACYRTCLAILSEIRKGSFKKKVLLGELGFGKEYRYFSDNPNDPELINPKFPNNEKLSVPIENTDIYVNRMLNTDQMRNGATKIAKHFECEVELISDKT